MTFTSSQPGTLLVIDSDSEAVESLAHWLKDRYQIHAARTGEQARTSVRAQLPDLVLIGTKLPDGESFALCRDLKGSAPEKFLPVILLIDKQDLPAANEFEADEVLLKPLHKPEVLFRIGAQLRLKHQFDALIEKNRVLSAVVARHEAALEAATRTSHEASVLKDSIVQNVSHELKTPLLQVKSATSMLAEDARAASPSGTSVLADHATAAVARLESVVQNITNLAASTNVKFEPFNLTDAVNVAIRQLGRQWASSAAVERIKVKIEDIPLLMGDRSAVAQVLQQLIDNGVKFSPNGGPVEITAQHAANGMRVAVRDYGIGIAADQREHIFQAFYQVDRGSTRRFSGTGVGLSIVKLILDKMGTSVEVESEPGVGSTFSFVLAIAEPVSPVTQEVSAG
jgi:two-component system phosphate regulon sensor histidine kinase PhoR